MGGWYGKKPDESTDGLSPTEFYLFSLVFLLSREVSYLISPMATLKAITYSFQCTYGYLKRKLAASDYRNVDDKVLVIDWSKIAH